MFDARLIEELRAKIAPVVLGVNFAKVCLLLGEHSLCPKKLESNVFCAGKALARAKADPSAGIRVNVQVHNDSEIGEELLYSDACGNTRHDTVKL